MNRRVHNDTSRVQVPASLEAYSPDPPASSALQVAHALREVILQSSQGQLLGGEDDLIARFAVSRPTIRQAVRILQAEGLLTVRRGVNGGLFAEPPTSKSVARFVSVLLRHHGVTFADLNSAIQALTGEMTRQAAAHPRKAARQHVAQQIHSHLPRAGITEAQKVSDAGVFFGRQVATLAPNPVVSLLLQVLVDLLAQQRDTPRPDGHYDELRNFHHCIADAIAAGDQLAVIHLCSDHGRQVSAWPV